MRLSETNTMEHKQELEKHTDFEITLMVNGEKKLWHSKELSYKEAIDLAYDGKPPVGDNWVFTVTYRRAEGRRPDGELLAGESVRVKNGTIINVTPTDKS